MKRFRDEWNAKVKLKIDSGLELGPEDIFNCTLIEDLPGEVWKPVVAAPDRYMVSNLGRLKDLVNNRVTLLQTKHDKIWYARVNVSKDVQR